MVKELRNLLKHTNFVFYGKGNIEEQIKEYSENLSLIEKKLKALDILIKWYQPDIIHDLCCLGASDEEIALVKETINEHR